MHLSALAARAPARLAGRCRQDNRLSSEMEDGLVTRWAFRMIVHDPPIRLNPAMGGKGERRNSENEVDAGVRAQPVDESKAIVEAHPWHRDPRARRAEQRQLRHHLGKSRAAVPATGEAARKDLRERL